LVLIEVDLRAFSLNQTYSWGRVYKAGKSYKANFYMNKKGKEFKTALYRAAKKQYNGDVLTTPIKMFVRCEYKYKYGKDVDNSLKLILDALQGVVYEDDNQVEKLLVEKQEGCEEDKIIIKIKEMI